MLGKLRLRPKRDFLIKKVYFDIALLNHALFNLFDVSLFNAALF